MGLGLVPMLGVTGWTGRPMRARLMIQILSRFYLGFIQILSGFYGLAAKFMG